MMPTPLRATLPGLGDHLREIGAARDKEARAAAFEALARRAEEAGASVPLVLRLISGDTNSMRFALEVAARLAAPLPGELLPPILDLLERPRLPSRLRIAATAQVIRSVPAGSPVVPRLLDALGRKVSPSRAVNRLRRLAALLPDSVPVAWALAELDSGSANPCPRCGARLGPDDFVGHLWERHRLLTENGRVREPWDLIGQWLNAYARTGRPEVLDRSCDLAQALDPAEGLTRAHRLLLKGGSDDEDARALLRAEAAERFATLCPHCFALVPLPSRPLATTVLVGTGRVDGGGYRVELIDKYLFSHLVVDTPEMRVYSGPEPGHALTRRGASLFFLVPLILLAALFSVMPAVLGIAPAVPVG